MQLSPFAWLRRRAAESVAAGVADALTAIAPDDSDPPPDLASLRAMLAQATQPRASLPPAQPDDEATVGRRKGARG
jgi:hypothetical protein